MGNNVVSIPFEDFEEADTLDKLSSDKDIVISFMGILNQWSADNGIDTETTEYRYQASVIMSQLQIMLMGVK